MMRATALFVLLSLSLPAAVPARAHDLPLDRLSLPTGFTIEHVADVPGARSILPVPALGVVFVSTRADTVYAVSGLMGDGGAVTVRPVLSGLKVANGIAWAAGFLYVAEQHRVVRFAAPSLKALARAKPEIIFGALPDKRHHGWRYSAFGPDGKLYIAIGAACNICQVSGMEGTIIRLNVNRPGAAPEVFARGVRNPVGLRFHPQTGHLWFTDNGADNMGDDSPPDELNRAPHGGLHFGYPYFGGGTDKTGEAPPVPPQTMTPPEVRFGAHVAALGFDFYTHTAFPPAYRGDAFVAQHGSWNRNVPDGYRIARVRMNGAKSTGAWEPFAEGWLDSNGGKWGRPVDVKMIPDGSLLVSDDRAGALYRIAYGKN